MDLKAGQVVHALAGRRCTYRPLHTPWISDAHQPIKLAKAVRERFQWNEWYVADLDAIEGRGQQHELIQQLVNDGFQLWLDAGIRTMSQVDDLSQRGLSRIILASECLQADESWQDLDQHPVRDQLVFSLDLFQGQVRTDPALFPGADWIDIIRKVHLWGIRTIMVLDVADVGMQGGCSTHNICREIHRLWPELEIVTGGGIRSTADITALSEMGVSRVLVSTWLHQFATTNVR
ncbi:MAG: HisA/HisF-related TIM barrel protein [Gemmatales bacterium]